LVRVERDFDPLGGNPVAGAPELVQSLLLLKLGAEARPLLQAKPCAAAGAESQNDSEYPCLILHVDLLMYSPYTSMYTSFTSNVNTVYSRA
jgi:hypothetical protein